MRKEDLMRREAKSSSSLLFLSSFILLSSFSCGGGGAAKLAPSDLEWNFDVLRADPETGPFTALTLSIKGKNVPIAGVPFGFTVTPRGDYEASGIPKDALAACRGWWAGAGEDYWALPGKDGSLRVLRKEMSDGLDPESEAAKGVEIASIDVATGKSSNPVIILEGSWKAEEGADVESMSFEGLSYSSYLHETLFETGSWKAEGEGISIDAQSGTMVFPSCEIRGDILILKDKDGRIQKFSRIRPKEGDLEQAE
jgi:hypothetical protein